MIGQSRGIQLTEDDNTTRLNESPVSLDPEKTEESAVRRSEVKISVSPGNEQHGKDSGGLSADDLLCFGWQINQGMVRNF